MFTSVRSFLCSRLDCDVFGGTSTSQTWVPSLADNGCDGMVITGKVSPSLLLFGVVVANSPSTNTNSNM